MVKFNQKMDDHYWYLQFMSSSFNREKIKDPYFRHRIRYLKGKCSWLQIYWIYHQLIYFTVDTKWINVKGNYIKYLQYNPYKNKVIEVAFSPYHYPQEALDLHICHFVKMMRKIGIEVEEYHLLVRDATKQELDPLVEIKVHEVNDVYVQQQLSSGTFYEIQYQLEPCTQWKNFNIKWKPQYHMLNNVII